MQLNVKRLTETAKLPTRNNPTDAGLDLYADHDADIVWSGSVKIKTGIAVAIPPGTAGLIFDRSSMGSKGISRLAGVIDSDYRGEIIVVLSNVSSMHRQTLHIRFGDKIAQLLIVPILLPEPYEVDDLGNTVRGDKGFGSSGK